MPHDTGASPAWLPGPGPGQTAARRSIGIPSRAGGRYINSTGNQPSLKVGQGLLMGIGGQRTLPSHQRYIACRRAGLSLFAQAEPQIGHEKQVRYSRRHIALPSSAERPSGYSQFQCGRE